MRNDPVKNAKAPAPRAAETVFDDGPETDGPLGLALDLMRRRPIDTLAGLVATAGVATILVNALLLQEGRHPAPLFYESASAPAAAAERSERVAQIQQALVERGLYDGAVDGLFGAKTASAIIAFEQSARLPATGEASERVLAALEAPRKDPAAMQPARPVPAPPAIRGAAQPPAPATTGSTTIATPKLMAVQRALAKLGYGPVTIDGKMGAETRAALISFQRDRKLAQTGEPTPQAMRELRAASGLALE